MKRIGLNALLYSPRLGGIGTYLQQLMKYLSQDDTLSIKIFVSQEEVDNNPAPYTADCYEAVSFYNPFPLMRLFNEHTHWPKTLFANQIDLFHSPISYISPGVTIPSILTVHDLRYFHYPETFTRARGYFLRYAIPRSLKQARHIIAVSEFTKSDIISLFDVPEEKITVIHEGIDPAQFSEPVHRSQVRDARVSHNAGVPYILAVGHLEPRKNYTRLLRAFDVLKHKYHIPHQLIIVGQDNWHSKEIFNVLRKLKLQDQVQFPGFVHTEELVFLLQHAEIFIAPSIFEGFGLTPLESMAAATPVVASDIPPHAEICGDATVYFNPFDVDDMVEKIYSLLGNETLQKQLIEQGRKQVKKWTWNNCLNQTKRVYRECLNNL